MLLSIGKAILYVIELCVGFETKLNINAEREDGKYLKFTHDLSSEYNAVKFLNLSLSTLRIFGKSYEPFIDLCKELGFTSST